MVLYIIELVEFVCIYCLIGGIAAFRMAVVLRNKGDVGLGGNYTR